MQRICYSASIFGRQKMIDTTRPIAMILGGASGLGLELARESERNGITPLLIGKSKSLEFPEDSHVYVDLSDSA
ncbi:MAG: hypothetical protein HYW88_02570, partial [Candidatus Sungbacteria bacterium]|nr:hypothetical protein [Candidatus Sungbacteria bacterium]